MNVTERKYTSKSDRKYICNIIDIWVWPMRKRTDTTGLWLFMVLNNTYIYGEDRTHEKKFKLSPQRRREKEKGSYEKTSIVGSDLLLKNRTGSNVPLLQPAYLVQLPCCLWKLIMI